MSRPRIVIVGAGFAGYRTARTPARLTRHQADITLLNPTDYFLYPPLLPLLPLLPQVAAGILEPRRVTVSLTGTPRDVCPVLGEADDIDLDIGEPRPYRHRDLGFVVDPGGVKAAANPLGIPLAGPVAGAVTRGCHLAAMPGNRVRVAADRLLDAVLPRQGVRLGLVRSWSVPLDTASPERARVPGGVAERPPARRTPVKPQPPAPRAEAHHRPGARSEGDS